MTSERPNVLTATPRLRVGETTAVINAATIRRSSSTCDAAAYSSERRCSDSSERAGRPDLRPNLTGALADLGPRGAATAQGTSPPSHAGTAAVAPISTVFSMHVTPAAIRRLALLTAETLRDHEATRTERSIGARRRGTCPMKCRPRFGAPRSYESTAKAVVAHRIAAPNDAAQPVETHAERHLLAPPSTTTSRSRFRIAGPGSGLP